ncbi:DUF5995 family protein [Salinigranum halophilum]|jgi:hypothetical protein|uniref:DUF5995 family protein n=1 Tax=Salinigranum halophilum TaxID=2565931 RepID=UPI00115EF70C|nr:DUF5995 family protein [Salinigranum halophilum]
MNTTTGIEDESGPSLGSELRAVVDRYRGWLTVDIAEPPAHPDPDLSALLASPFSSVDDVHDRLSAAETHLRGEGDRRAVFLTVYAAMTARVRAGLTSGVFDDPEWVRQYLVAFAEYYRRALVAFERGERVAPAWRVAFGASRGGETLVIQDALLGINAHIVNDLTFALDDVGVGTGRERDRRHADHLAVNTVLKQLADVVQTTLAEVYAAAGLTEVDELFGRFDERATLVGLRTARAFAWENAVSLADWPRLAPLVRWRVRTVSAGAAYALLAPGLDSTVLEQLVAVERGEPVLAALSGALHRDDAEQPV